MKIEPTFDIDDVILCMESMVSAFESIRRSITDDCGGNDDATGGHVRCLTEAVMGMTGGLVKIADAVRANSIDDVSDNGQIVVSGGVETGTQLNVSAKAEL